MYTNNESLTSLNDLMLGNFRDLYKLKFHFQFFIPPDFEAIKHQQIQNILKKIITYVLYWLPREYLKSHSQKASV